MSGYRDHEESGMEHLQRNKVNPVIDPKGRDICKFPDKEFKIIFLKILRDLQENAHRQFNKIKKIIQEQNEKFDKEIGNIKRVKEKFWS